MLFCACQFFLSPIVHVILMRGILYACAWRSRRKHCSSAAWHVLLIFSWELVGVVAFLFVTLAATATVMNMHKSADPSVGVWGQIHSFFFAGGGSGGEDRLGLLTVGARSEPGWSQAGATTGNPKQRRNSRVAPTRQRRGRRQWRQPLNFM